MLTLLADVNECTEETDNCDNYATCTNTNGSFVCTCNQGYSGDGVTCSGIIKLCLGVSIQRILRFSFNYFEL